MRKKFVCISLKMTEIPVFQTLANINKMNFNISFKSRFATKNLGISHFTTAIIRHSQLTRMPFIVLFICTLRMYPNNSFVFKILDSGFKHLWIIFIRNFIGVNVEDGARATFFQTFVCQDCQFSASWDGIVALGNRIWWIRAR